VTVAQQLNLFDPALLRKRDWLALANVVMLALLLLVAVAVAATVVRRDVPSLTAQVATNENQLKLMREQVIVLGQRVANRKPDQRLENELSENRLLLDARNAVLTALRQRMDPSAGSFAEYLRGFARQSVSGLWLTGIAVDAASHGMEIRGRTIDPALLPEYIQRMNKEPAFQGRAFSALKLAEGKTDVVPGTPAATNAAANTPADAAKKALFHEFTLIPLSPAANGKGGQAASGQTSGQTTGRPGQ
jgi:hypothetical protein